MEALELQDGLGSQSEVPQRGSDGKKLYPHRSASVPMLHDDSDGLSRTLDDEGVLARPQCIQECWQRGRSHPRPRQPVDCADRLCKPDLDRVCVERARWAQSDPPHAATETEGAS